MILRTVISQHSFRHKVTLALSNWACLHVDEEKKAFKVIETKALI